MCPPDSTVSVILLLSVRIDSRWCSSGDETIVQSPHYPKYLESEPVNPCLRDDGHKPILCHSGTHLFMCLAGMSKHIAPLFVLLKLVQHSSHMQGHTHLRLHLLVDVRDSAPGY